MSSGRCPVLLVGRSIPSLSTQQIILEKAGYAVALARGEQEAAYLLKKHRMAASVLSLSDEILKTYIFAAVIVCHTVPMEERHRIGTMVRDLAGSRPKLLVLHRSGHCAESKADAAIDSLEGQGKILALLKELIEGKQARRVAAPLNIEYAGAESARSNIGASDGSTEGRHWPKI